LPWSDDRHDGFRGFETTDQSDFPKRLHQAARGGFDGVFVRMNLDHAHTLRDSAAEEPGNREMRELNQPDQGEHQDQKINNEVAAHAAILR